MQQGRKTFVRIDCPGRRSGWILLLAATALLIFADGAFAWGSATHIDIASQVLNQLGFIPAAIAVVLAKHTDAYLYGSVAADVVFAKRMSRVKQFCHHWSTGFKVLERAETPEGKAFAYGYLSHLAADTVAHGKYVPRQIAVTGSSMTFGHFYWEVRADGLEDSDTWKRLRTLLRQTHDPHHDLLAEQLRGTFLPYIINRRLFEGMNRTVSHPLPRLALDALADYSRHELSPRLVRSYIEESVDRTISLLQKGDASLLLREDPNGTAALMQTHVLRRDVKRRQRRGQESDQLVREQAAGFVPQIRVRLSSNESASADGAPAQALEAALP